jgi:hypothetical protein
MNNSGTGDIAPVWADFNKIGRSPGGEQARILLTAAGTLSALARRGIQLREGMPVYLYDQDQDDRGRPDYLVAEGVARYDEDRRQWTAVIRTGQIRRLSDALQEPEHWATSVDWGTVDAA